jgi:polyisoprenoid-binding protein YceI
MRASALLFTLALAACATASGAGDQPPPFAAAGPPAATPTADYPIAVDLPAGAYQLDPRHANVTFRIRHMGLSWFTARFDAEAGTLTLDPADPSRSQLRASVDANSVNTGVLNAQGERAFDRSIGRALGVEATPTIEFVSTSIERTGQHTARIVGNLTMNGQTHPAMLEATFDGAAVDPLRGGNTVLGFSAHGAIDRTQWGVSQWRSVAGDEVQIVIEAEFVRG